MSEVDDFLEKIAFLESSGGKNFGHREITSGIHQGHRAAGTYGIMPNTALEIYNRAKVQGRVTPKMEKMHKLRPKDMKHYIENNPDLEKDLAKILAERVLSTSSSPDKAAYKWFMGHNLTDDKLDKRDWENTEYVKRFRKQMEQTAPKNKPLTGAPEIGVKNVARNKRLDELEDLDDIDLLIDELDQEIAENPSEGLETQMALNELEGEQLAQDDLLARSDVGQQPMDIQREPTPLPPLPDEPPRQRPLDLMRATEAEMTDIPDEEQEPSMFPGVMDMIRKRRR